AAPVRAHEADDHVEAGGLAGPVGPQQRDDLPAFELEVEGVDHAPAAVTLAQAAGLEDRIAAAAGGRYLCSLGARLLSDGRGALLGAVRHAFQSRHMRAC